MHRTRRERWEKRKNTNIRSIQKTHQVHRCAERDQSHVLSTNQRPFNLCAATSVEIGIAVITCEHLARHHLRDVMDPTSTHTVQWNSTLTDLLSSMMPIVVAMLCTQGRKLFFGECLHAFFGIQNATISVVIP